MTNDLDLPTAARAATRTDSKPFHEVAAHAALKGVAAWRSDPQDGPQAFFLEHEGVVYRVRDLRAVTGFLSHIRG